MKFLILLAFIVIIGSLISAGVFMVRGGRDGEEGSRRMVRALTVRISVSVIVFIALLVAYRLGWIQPTGLVPGR